MQERNRVDSDSDEDRVPYTYNTDHDDSSYESSEEGSSRESGRQQGSGFSSEIPRSVNTNTCAPPWTYETVDEDDYDADHDDDVKSIAPLRMRGGGTPVVEAATDEDTEEGFDKQPQSQPTQNPLIPTTTKKIQPPSKPDYDPMKDDPPPEIITPSYIPLWKKNEH